jgi:hypothetical protein
VGHLFLSCLELISGGEALMKILDSTPHGNNLKKSSQINGLGIQKWRMLRFNKNILVNYAPTLGWSLRLFLGGSLFLDDEQILFIYDVYL